MYIVRMICEQHFPGGCMRVLVDARSINHVENMGRWRSGEKTADRMMNGE